MTDYRVALGVLVGLLAAAPQGAAQSVSGRGTAAMATLPAIGSQSFARATLPLGGGMKNADVDVASVVDALGANGLTSMTTGQIDETLVTATTTAQAADVDLLNGLITANAVLALATSTADGATATSEASGSTLLGLVVNGVSYDDGAPAPNTRVDLPGVGYVVLNQQVATGDGVHATGLTVTMIHLYLVDPVTGQSTGNIVVARAQSAASL